MTSKIRYSLLITLMLLTISVRNDAQLQKPTKVYDPELNKLIVKNEQTKDERQLRYKPEGTDFVIINGKKKFNRALYSPSHTAFRVETSDVPEFALYLPHMGGNLSFGIKTGNQQISLNEAQKIECRYRPGTRIYKISDPILGKGEVRIDVLSMTKQDGMILKISFHNISKNTSLTWRFGGAADKRFSRNGDLGVDPPDCFDLKPEYCKGNIYNISGNIFNLTFGKKQDKQLMGIFPPSSILSIDKKYPLINGDLKLKKNGTIYLAILIPQSKKKVIYQSLSNIFKRSEDHRDSLANRIEIKTPDPFINTLGGTVTIAADGIWSGQVWLHGAVGWRMPLPGWRAAYTGDVLGWHNRSKKHFEAYAASQVTNVPPIYPHPNMDTINHLARGVEKWGTQMYSNGYICRNPYNNHQMHHYDMNLCYIDELLWHFNWTGDTLFMRKMWPVLKASLAWEKRNYDPNNDGLYDAYCCIWASDALYYNGGAVTHSTAYNYRANKMAAEIAQKLGYDPTPYQKEADKILKAMKKSLWIPSLGHWAEFRDLMGDKLLHKDAALWTIYHAVDEGVDNAFGNYQSCRYVDTEIPHIPVEAKGIEKDKYFTLSTSDWMPYAWSINNVAMAEVMHTALAFWESGLYDNAFNMFKSNILDFMYLGSSPGNIGQISYYDAARGESYRDFGDPIGMTSRAIVQGLFGIEPDLLNNQLTIRPGFPENWDSASIKTPDIYFDFNRKNNINHYIIEQHLDKIVKTELIIPIKYDKIVSIKVNGKNANWSSDESVINKFPMIRIQLPAITKANVQIITNNQPVNSKITKLISSDNKQIRIQLVDSISKLYDPQKILRNAKTENTGLTGEIAAKPGNHTLFIKVKQGNFSWWKPVDIDVKQIKIEQPKAFSQVDTQKCETVDLTKYYNDSVTNIFKHKYLSPRPPYTSLEIPYQGIGEWCHPSLTANIEDSGFRKAVVNGVFHSSLGVPFMSDATGKNIVFTSRWDNFPLAVKVPVSGKASHAYLLMAGTTNQMQYKVDNGYVIASYTDGTKDTLHLVNPTNWCPIEQDFYVDGKAFRLSTPRPYRIQLKTAYISNNLGKDLHIKGVYGREIDGGAGVLLDMPLNKDKELSSITLKTEANEVIIGLMGLTLQR